MPLSHPLSYTIHPQAGPLLTQFSKGMSAGSRMFAIMQRAPKIDAAAPGLEPAAVKGEIELKNVTFAYVSARCFL